MQEEMQKLVDELNAATAAYDAGHPIMSDSQWDDLYFKLLDMERTCGFALRNSPTCSVYYTEVSKLAKATHNHPMLSLDKVKDTIVPLEEKFNNKEFLAMCKMDGLTCSLEYDNGWLVGAETRGNGEIGEDIYHNAIIIPSIPNHIRYKKHLIVDGEIICRYCDFEEFSNEYSNPRNFAAGSIRLLNSAECATRKLTFIAWDVIDGFNETNLLSEKFNKLATLDFIIVPFIKSDVVDVGLLTAVKRAAEANSYPIDGVVFKYNDVEYGRSLGSTSHHANNAMAYKFYDETYETTLKDIEWSLGRTGVLTPVAVFEPVDTGDSIIERASLHNASMLEETLHGIGWPGQKIKVAKMNMIIPQIVEAENEGEVFTPGRQYFPFPDKCPICGETLTLVKSDAGVEQLTCTNALCEGKLANHIDHFCSKSGLDIKGLSKKTIEKLIDWNYVNSLIDIFNLRQYRAEWIKKEGFGPTSVDKILDTIDNTIANVEFPRFLAAIGIPLVGLATAKIIGTAAKDWATFRSMVNDNYSWSSINTIGPEIENAINNFNYDELDKIVDNYITFITPIEDNKTTTLNGLTICITGRLSHFKSRDELKQVIENAGGKVVGAVSGNTNILINNDSTSTSSKNLTAKKNGTPILTEAEFIEKYLK